MENSYEAINIYLQSRKEYIDEFLSKRFFPLPSNKTKKGKLYSPKDRWNFLYNLDKLKQIQLKDQIKEHKKKLEEEILNECTFTPKINKKKNSIYILNNNLNVIKRLEKWNERKKEHIKDLNREKNNKLMKECFFTPEINNNLNKSQLKLKAIKLLEDPESYNQYLKRLEKKRKNEERLKRQNSYSGNCFYIKKLNNNYDYTKHSLTEKILPKSLSNKFIKNYNLKNYINYDNIDRDKYYEKIYLKNNSNIHFNTIYSKINTEYDNQGNKESDNFENDKNIFFNKPLDYYQAKKILHNELFSFSILKEDE